MNTTTKTATAPIEMEVATEKGAIAVFQPPRLPYHVALKDRFNIEPSGWKALVEAIYPAAKTVDAVVMALSYCKARGLDPFKRPVHIVPMWDSNAGPEGRGGYVETIWPGISELRTTAFRTGNYAGSDEAEFGPMIEHSFHGRVQVWKNRQKEWQDKEVTVKAPEWCRITVYRDLHGRLCKFVGPKVVWLEAYATIGKSELPNDMWQSRPEGQLEKCAEAAALRKAFPEELGNELTAEEMAGRQIRYDDRLEPERMVQSTPSAEPPPPSAVKGGKPPAEASAQSEQHPAKATQEAEPEIIEGEIVGTDEPQEQGDIEQSSGKPLSPEEEIQWLKDVDGALSGCEDLETFGAKQKQVMAPMKWLVTTEAWTKAQHLAEDAYRRLAGA